MRLELIAYERISIIKPLWEKLNQLHLEDSKYFKDHFQYLTFEARYRSLKQKDEMKSGKTGSPPGGMVQCSVRIHRKIKLQLV